MQYGAKKKEKEIESFLDFSIFDKEKYFKKELIYPIKTSNSCPYKGCTFCTHHENKRYACFDIARIKETIIKNNIKKICFIDDGITCNRLLELSAMLKPLNVEWWCQLRPIKGMIPILPKLFEAGLKSISWGVESGSQDITDKMNKGLNINDVEHVLQKSKNIGIINQLYIMFGFPGETIVDAEKTIQFLKKNANIMEDVVVVPPNS